VKFIYNSCLWGFTSSGSPSYAVQAGGCLAHQLGRGKGWIDPNPSGASCAGAGQGLDRSQPERCQYEFGSVCCGGDSGDKSLVWSMGEDMRV
jgi:hypothetical protein